MDEYSYGQPLLSVRIFVRIGRSRVNGRAIRANIHPVPCKRGISGSSKFVSHFIANEIDRYEVLQVIGTCRASWLVINNSLG